MISFETILLAILPIYLLVALGCVLRWRKVLTAEMEKGMMQFVVHCLFPCLIIDKMIGSEVLRTPSTVGWGISLGFIGILCGILIAYGIGTLLGLDHGSGRRTFALSSGIQNYGYVAVPLLAALFATDGRDDVLGMLFVHSVGVEIAIWSIGLITLSGTMKGALKNLCNGPIIAVFVGLILVYTNGWLQLDLEKGALVGKVIRQVMTWLGACAFPVALVLIGATMFDLLGKERLSLKVSLGAVLVRTILMPIALLCAGKWLPIVTELQQVLLVQAAMPAAVTPILLARMYGGRPQIAMQVFLVTAFVGLFSMPLIVAWGLKFIGLN